MSHQYRLIRSLQMMAFTIRLLRQKKKFITTWLLDNDSSAILEFLVSLKVFLDYWCCCSCSCSCSCLCCCRYSCYSYCGYRWCYCCCCWRRIGGNANTAMQLACPAAMLFEERNACRSATCRCCTALLLERYLQNCYFLVSFMTEEKREREDAARKRSNKPPSKTMKHGI